MSLIFVVLSDGFRIFQRKVRQSIIWQNVCRKCMKMKEIGGVSVATPGCDILFCVPQKFWIRWEFVFCKSTVAADNFEIQTITSCVLKFLSPMLKGFKYYTIRAFQPSAWNLYNETYQISPDCDGFCEELPLINTMD